jgi:hypothetical protein
MKNNMTTVISSNNSNSNNNNDNEEAKEAEASILNIDGAVKEAEKIIVFSMPKRDPSGYSYIPKNRRRYEDIFFREILGVDGKVLDYEKITKEEANRIRKKNQRKTITETKTK